MSADMARKHAESLAGSIKAAVEAGAPFGYTNAYTGEWCDWEDFEQIPEDERGDYTEASAFDWLGDALNIDYVVGSDRETVKGGRIMVGFGGPNVWVDTMTNTVDVSWWSDEASVRIPREFCERIDDALQELWNC